MNDDQKTLIEKIVSNEASKEELENFISLVNSNKELKKAYEVERALNIAQKLLKKEQLIERFRLINQNESVSIEETESEKMIRYMNAAYENKEVVERFSGSDGLITYETIKSFLEDKDDEDDE